MTFDEWADKKLVGVEASIKFVSMELFREGWDAAVTEAVEACRGEHLLDMESVYPKPDPEDICYENAINHCERAVALLKSRTLKGA